MERDIFEGVIEEEICHVLDKASELEPGSQEYLNAMKAIKEMADIRLENERLADEAEAKAEEAKTEKKKILVDIGKFAAGTFVYAGLTKFLTKFAETNGNIPYRDALKILDFLRPKK